MMYPQHIVDDIRQKLLVSQLVGRYVSLRRHGREFSGLCPFHKEKTPSFTVNDEKGFYHCFGCGQHGDIFSFVKEYEKISYREAIQKLAAEVGVSLPAPSAQQAKEEKKIKDIQHVMEIACQWFESRLLAQEGHVARHYITQRGLSEQSVSRYRMGFAPDSADAMIVALEREGVSRQQMLAAGLVAMPEGRSAYARFRGRLIFPIRDARSRVVAFGGRVLPGLGHADAAKYLNSPETECFHKGQMLFNYDLARLVAIEKQQLIVCEGYMDVIALSQAGIDQAVAPLGTAITREQLLLMWNICDVPTLCLDGDAAGERAMQRALNLALPLLKPGKSLAFARLPRGEDPDSLVRGQGAEGLLTLVSSAPVITDMLWRQAEEEMSRAPELRAGQEQKLMQLAESIEDPTVKSHVRSFFRDQLWRSMRPVAGARAGDRTRPKHTASAPVAALPVLPPLRDTASQKERALSTALAWALRSPYMLFDAQREELLACAVFSAPQVQMLCHQLLEYVQQQAAHQNTQENMASDFIQTRDPAQKAVAQQLLDRYAPLSPVSGQRDSVRLAQYGWQMAQAGLHLIELQEEYALLSQRLVAESSPDVLEQMRFLTEKIQELQQQQAYLMQQEMDVDG